MKEDEQPVSIYVLADGAAHPGRIGSLLREAHVEFRNVFAGLPEADAGDASLLLARVDDTKAPWLAQVDAMDMQAPCLTLIWSRVEIDALARHLHQFLIADIGEGMTALIRYYDPRNLVVAMEVWGDDIAERLMQPIEQWKYRGYHEAWQRLEGPMGGTRTQDTALAISLSQQQLDRLTEHCEPDQLLATLVENGTVAPSEPYLERFMAFLPRYQRAAAWGLTEPADRLRFCELSYQFGEAFDQHEHVTAALRQRQETGTSMAACEQAIHPSVWEQLQARQKAAEGKA
ncbi:DUF4123 domain-containing protein [Cupriavidus malaysiensis]|uniref:DUF4123 domain-containing protein n=1 Tax=Cupriavidus malaysiensis TaxID=367825 RepID=A0ABN4TYB7_9BURK|nr:DUF4123 domain-containing protein [Cupriavidus malaysiensis]AOZ09951.1 hypothetical protein BKK80_30215 [Cupriavidus malaysiensis]